MIRSSTFHVLYIFFLRSAKQLQNTFKDLFINNLVPVIFVSFVFGYLTPRIGLKSSLGPENFIGTLFTNMLFMSWFHMSEDVNDLAHTRLIDYYRILPISHDAFMVMYLIKYLMLMVCGVLPMLCIGKLVLGALWPWHMISWAAFSGIFVTSILFVGTLSLVISFGMSQDAFYDNFFTRIFFPLTFLGGAFFPWHELVRVSPIVGRISLLNPATYIIEGMRRALIGGEQYISVSVCVVALSIATVLNVVAARRMMRKRLQAV